MPGQQIQPQQQIQQGGNQPGQQQQMANSGGGKYPSQYQPRTHPACINAFLFPAPSINPTTGQPDYSAQWCEYYRSMGMHDQANMIEAQMKQQQAQQGARPQQAYYS